MGVKMNVKFTVKRKLVVNGKEYGSLEEMPDEDRRIYEKAVNSSTDMRAGTSFSHAKVKIAFNGRQYESPEGMPEDVRDLYRKVTQAVRDGGVSSAAEMVAGADTGSMTRRSDEPTPPSSGVRKPVVPEPTFSPLLLILAVGLVLLFFCLCYVLHRGIFR